MKNVRVPHFACAPFRIVYENVRSALKSSSTKQGMALSLTIILNELCDCRFTSFDWQQEFSFHCSLQNEHIL
jgi:hypothetical protein